MPRELLTFNVLTFNALRITTLDEPYPIEAFGVFEGLGRRSSEAGEHECGTACIPVLASGHLLLTAGMRTARLYGSLSYVAQRSTIFEAVAFCFAAKLASAFAFTAASCYRKSCRKSYRKLTLDDDLLQHCYRSGRWSRCRGNPASTTSSSRRSHHFTTRNQFRRFR